MLFLFQLPQEAKLSFPISFSFHIYVLRKTINWMISKMDVPVASDRSRRRSCKHTYWKLSVSFIRNYPSVSHFFASAGIMVGVRDALYDWSGRAFNKCFSYVTASQQHKVLLWHDVVTRARWRSTFRWSRRLTTLWERFMLTWYYVVVEILCHKSFFSAAFCLYVLLFRDISVHGLPFSTINISSHKIIILDICPI